MWGRILSKGGSLLELLPLRQIMLYSIVILLGATLLLGSMLKHQLERNGLQEARLEEAYRGQASLRLSLDKEKDSCRETIGVLTKNIQIKQQSDRATIGLLRRAEEVMNERETMGDSSNPSALLQLLNSATCQARNNGLPCSTPKPAQ